MKIEPVSISFSALEKPAPIMIAPVERKDGNTMKIVINGVEYEVSEQVAQAITRERTDAAEKLAAAKKERSWSWMEMGGRFRHVPRSGD